MKGRKSKKITLKDVLADDIDKLLVSNKDKLSAKYSRSLKDASGDKDLESLYARSGKGSKFSLRTRILKSKWVGNKPASKAISWIFKEVFKDPKTYRYARKLMAEGHLFTFKYFNPKYKGTSILPWFDKFPLVLSLGPRITNLGIRNLGFNLHLLPPKIRIIVICYIFELYKVAYRHNIITEKENNPIKLNYHQIQKEMSNLGIEFCVRMYIPSRQVEIVRFPIKDWEKAIFMPSRGYDGIRAAKLIKEWQYFCKSKGISISPSLNWKTRI